MRVLILNPPTLDGVKFIREGRCEQRLSSFQYVMVPISLPSTAAALRAEGHQVTIVDAIASDLDLDAVIDRVKPFKAALVLADVSTPTFHQDMQAIAAIKKQVPARFGAFGTHVTALPEQSLESSQLDFVIRREPEITAVEAANALEARGHLAGVSGTSYKVERGVVNNPDRPFIEDLDQLPFPARDLISAENYTMPISNRPYTLVITSRGCPHRCIYCTAHQYYGHKLRLRSPGKIVDEIEEIKEEHGVEDITFWSDTFTLNREFVVDVSSEIKERGVRFRWMANSRVDRVDPELLTLMRGAGCTMLSFGVESGSQDILDNIHKQTTVDQARNAFAWCREAGIRTIAHFILGLPGETKATVNETKKLARQLNADYAQFYGAIPFPGTEFYRIAKRNGWTVTDDWSKYELNQTIVSTPDLSAADLEEAKRAAFRSFYLRPNYMLKQLGQVRSVREGLNLPRQSVSFMKEWVRGK